MEEQGNRLSPRFLASTISTWLLLLMLMISLVPMASCQSARIIKLPLTRATTQAAGLYGQPVINYYTPVSIGTPGKVFNIQFDVALGESFVPHYEWSPFKINMHYGKGYQCKVSSTCVKKDQTFVIEYQHCKLTGKPNEDIMNFVADYQNSSQQQQQQQNASTIPRPISLRHNFLAINDASDARFKNLPIDGFFGLAPQSSTPVENILFSLHKAHLIDNLQFSMWFSPVLDSAHGGELILGGQDTTRYQGKVYWHHVSNMNQKGWAMALQYVSLGNQVLSCDRKQCKAVISSGVNEVFGPQADVKQIYSLLNTTRSGNLELVDCRRINQMPILTFTVDGIPYALLPSNYIRKTVSGTIFQSETCYVAILPSTDSQEQQQWTLGTNFLGAYYTIFDMTYRQVGFATLR